MSVGSHRTPLRQQGIALPVVLIILAAMLVSGVYLLKTVHSGALTAGNLAYDETLSRSVDLGLHTGFAWLRDKAAANKPALDQDDSANGYRALLDPNLTPRDAAFWTGSRTIDGDDGTRVEYVIHRLCAQALPYADIHNECLLTPANTAALGNATPLGTSLASTTPAYAGSPQLHYLITARIARGKRGASVTNEMVVLIGA